MKDRLKIIIPLLLAVAIGLCYYKFSIPLKEDLERLQREETQLRQEYEANLERIQSIPALRIRIEETEEELELLAKYFYDNWPQEEYIMRLREFGNESKISISSLNYSEDSVLTVEYSVPASTAQSSSSEGDDTEDVSLAQMQKSLEIANKTVYRINFTGTYAQLKTLMQLIDWDETVSGYSSDGKFIVCDQLTVNAQDGQSVTVSSPGAEGVLNSRTATISSDRLTCSIEIGFYYLVGFEDYNLHENYVNLLKERGLRKTGDSSPFKRVN